MKHRATIWPGRPYPLGATWDGKGVNFALFTAHAEKVEICLFDDRGLREIGRHVLPEYTDQVWHGYLPEVRPGQLYGYRVYGAYDPANGHRFNGNKLLIDPYARLLSGKLRWSDAHFSYRVGTPRADLSFDRRDNASGMPKCVVVDTSFTWGSDRPLYTRWHESFVYELHVRGLTIRNTEVPANLRGTFLGLSQPNIIEHLTHLGVTAVELLPVQSFVDDRHLVEQGLRNFWGYNTLNFFAPEQRYLSGESIDEFKTMVRRFHDGGIEVLLDVVYNHTAEGNHLGPTLSFRGIDNKTYYHLVPGNERYYLDFTGTGNSLNLQRPRVLQMVMDSLRYWVQEMHVDGFRFDLAPTLARTGTGFSWESGFLEAIAQDPVLSRVKLIAEPWDVGEGGYQVGHFPPGWSEWNDRYRDSVRRFWQGMDGTIPEFASRLCGSSEIFDRDGRRPRATANFVTAHDGFTLTDLVSYNGKHNDANREENRDGTNENHSWNCGTEGPTADLRIRALRAKQRRNLIATLLLSQGLPMMRAGDEFNQSQGGNNNPYCQDNEISYLDWEDPDRNDGDLVELIHLVMKLRNAHPAFRRPRFLRGAPIPGTALKDIAWLTPQGREMSDADWHDLGRRCLGLHLGGDPGDSFISLLGYRERDDNFLMILNAHDEAIEWIMPKAETLVSWELLLDTNWPQPNRGGLRVPVAGRYRVEPRSMTLFIGNKT